MNGDRAAELVMAIPDPLAEIELRRQVAREAYELGRVDGFHTGAVEAIAAYKAAQHGIYSDAQLEQRRWHLCCGPCRRAGHRDGCGRCEDRRRETFGQPHPDDFPGRRVTAA